jgi:hypothetical protein
MLMQLQMPAIGVCVCVCVRAIPHVRQMFSGGCDWLLPPVHPSMVANRQRGNQVWLEQRMPVHTRRR